MTENTDVADQEESAALDAVKDEEKPEDPDSTSKDVEKEESTAEDV